MSGLQAVDSLRHFAGKANELQTLRDRVQELESLLGISDDNQLWRLKLTPMQAAFVGLLYKGGLVRRQAAYTAIYGARSECDQPEVKIFDVQILRIRKLLAPHNITIETVSGVGWNMSVESKERLRAVIEGMAGR